MKWQRVRFVTDFARTTTLKTGRSKLQCLIIEWAIQNVSNLPRCWYLTIIRYVVGKEKMVIRVADLNIDVSNLFVHIMDILMSDIAHVVDNDQPPT